MQTTFDRILSRTATARVLMVGLGLLATVVTTAPAFSQQPPVPASTDEKPVTISFSVMGWSDGIEGLSYRQGTRLKPLDFRPFRRSEDYDYTGRPVLELCRERKTDHGTMETVTVASVPIPENSQRFNILVFPSGADTYQAFPINESLDQFPAGKVMIFNFTPFTVAVRCNRQEVRQIESGKAVLATPQNGVLEYDIRYRKDDRWLIADRNRVTCTEDLQFSLFVASSQASYFRSNLGGQSSAVSVLFLPRRVDDAKK